jgi:hypothetical protein
LSRPIRPSHGFFVEGRAAWLRGPEAGLGVRERPTLSQGDRFALEIAEKVPVFERLS